MKQIVRLKNRLKKHAVYWGIKKWISSNVIFHLFSIKYRTSAVYKDKKNSLFIAIKSLKSVTIFLIVAVVFIGLTQIIGERLPLIFPKHITDDRIGTLISTIVTVGGIFLGLYFTALSVVVGNLLINVSENLRKEFIKEKRSNQYIYTIALTTIIGVLYLLLRSLDYSIYPLGPLLLVVMTCYAVARFLSLGMSSFHFIRIEETCALITKKCADHIEGVTINGREWRINFLQNHRRKWAAITLETLDDLVDFSTRTLEASEQQLSSIARQIGGLIVFYLQKKNAIPSKSFWYRKKLRHKNWLLANDSELLISLSTGTGLRPDSIEDRLWFEQRCLDQITQLFDYCFDKKLWGAAQICLEMYVAVNNAASTNLYEDVVKLSAEKVNQAMDKIIANPLTEPEDIRGAAALIDGIGRNSIEVAVGLLRYINEHSDDQMASKIRRINFKNEKSFIRPIFLGVRCLI